MIPFKYVHQPYIFKNHLLFTASNTITKLIYSSLSITDNSTITNNILWQLYISDFQNNEITNIKYIVTGYDIICSPVLYEFNNKIKLSFVGGKLSDFSIKYNLLTCDYDINTNKIDNIITIQNNCFYGCINNLYYLYGNRRNTGINLIFNNNEYLVLELNKELDYIYRVVYLEKNITTILITGKLNNNFKTIVFDIYQNKIIGELLADDKSVYKSIYNDKYCVYSNKLNSNSGFEERQLIITKNYKICLN